MPMKPCFAGMLLALAVVLGGCATNPITGRSQFLMVSEQSAIASSKQAYSSMLAPLEKKGKLNSDAALNQRIESITSKLVAQAVRYKPESNNWAWQVSVIDDPKTVNAFCMPGGKMAIYTGLIEKLEATDDEIAQVMGHEIGHAIANHGAEKMSVQMATQLGVAVVAAALGGNSSNRQTRENSLALAAALVVTLPNSRDAEREADRIGIELAARAGYNPDAAVSLWSKMMEQGSSRSKFDLLSTHPASPARMDELAALKPHMQQFYESKEPRPTFALHVGDNEAVVSTNEAVVSANETPVEPGAAAVQSKLVAPAVSALAAQAPAPLTLFSPQFEQFRKGEARLECTDCGLKFGFNRNELKKFHDAGNWRALAQRVVEINYKQDLGCFYLGRAAEKLGYSAAALVYYRLAGDAAKSKDSACAESLFGSCAGFDIAVEAAAGQRRVQGKAAGLD